MRKTKKERFKELKAQLLRSYETLKNIWGSYFDIETIERFEKVRLSEELEKLEKMALIIPAKYFRYAGAYVFFEYPLSNSLIESKRETITATFKMYFCGYVNISFDYVLRTIYWKD